jgi:hypothetical protein
MRRPLANKRPIGPFINISGGQSDQFSQSSELNEEAGDVLYTLLYSSPNVPGFGRQVDVTESTIESEVTRSTSLTRENTEILIESIVPKNMRQDGNLIVIKVMADMDTDDVVRLSKDIEDSLESTGIDPVSRAVYTNDFFKDSNVEQIDLEVEQV